MHKASLILLLKPCNFSQRSLWFCRWVHPPCCQRHKAYHLRFSLMIEMYLLFVALVFVLRAKASGFCGFVFVTVWLYYSQISLFPYFSFCMRFMISLMNLELSSAQLLIKKLSWWLFSSLKNEHADKLLAFFWLFSERWLFWRSLLWNLFYL